MRGDFPAPYKSLHNLYIFDARMQKICIFPSETLPALCDRGPETTMDISFSLRQDPLEQALFGE